MNYGRQVVERTLDSLEIEYEEQAHGYWAMAICPLHDDRSPSFAVNLNEGGWVCYSGCGSSGDLAELVSRLSGEPVAEIRTRLRREMPIDDEALKRSLTTDLLSIDEDIEFKPDLSYNKNVVPKYIKRRGFTDKTIKDWEVGWDQERRCAVIPCRQDGKLVGLIRRRVEPGNPKYLNTDGMSKGKYLLGLDHLVFGETSIVLVEGPLDAMWLYQHDISAAAIMGSSLSDEQADLLLRRFWTITLALDGDDAGRSGTKKALSRLKGKMTVKVAHLPEGKDVQNLDAEQLELVIKSAIIAS